MRAKIKPHALVLWSFVALLGLGCACVMGIALLFWFYSRDIAAIDVQAIREYRPPQVTRILSRDGKLIGEIFEERRTLVPYEQVPSHVENAFLAAEDSDFYRHEGMDYVAMARALFANIEAGEIRQGASTITQQVVKNFLLSPERTLARKVQEIVLARRLEQALDKRAILELYLNEIYLGHGRYGIQEASRFYFGKDVAYIDAGQAAMLASLPKAPSRDSPFKEPERARERQHYVLRQMVAHGFLSPREAQRYLENAPELANERTETRIVAGAPEFVDAAREELLAKFGKVALTSLGATVTTSVDLSLQAATRDATLAGLMAIDKRQGYGHRILAADEKHRARAVERGRGQLQLGQVYPIVIESRSTATALPADAVAGKVGDTHVLLRVPEGSRYDEPDKAIDEQFPPGGITMAKIVRLARNGEREDWAEAVVGSGPEVAVVLADTHTGEVLAMVGGSDYQLSGFNRAMHAARQPGSAFKPFVFGAALATRNYTAASLLSDSPEIYEKWRPTNFEPDVYRGDIRLRVALTHSVNTVAIKLLDAIGFDAVHAFARATGIVSPLVENLSLALGTSEVKPIELLTGYLTLARGGDRIKPSVILRIDIPGQSASESSQSGERTVSQDVAFVLTSMLQSVVEEGTGHKAKALGRPVAGKTGTSADYRDAWFAGYTPAHVAVVWVGFDVPQRIGRNETGGRAALPIWLSVMKAAEQGKPATPFVPPANVSIRSIDMRSGLLASTPIEPGATPVADVVEEYFVAGTEPIEHAEPGAVPAGDVMLDLYGVAEQPAGAVAEATAPRRGDSMGEDEPPLGDGGALPSLDDP